MFCIKRNDRDEENYSCRLHKLTKKESACSQREMKKLHSVTYARISNVFYMYKPNLNQAVISEFMHVADKLFEYMYYTMYCFPPFSALSCQNCIQSPQALNTSNVKSE